MNKGEPPSCANSEAPLFLIGKDSHGRWVVQDKSGLRGGLFRGRAEALKFAMFETDHRPQAVIMVPGVPRTQHELPIAHRGPQHGQGEGLTSTGCVALLITIIDLNGGPS